MKKRSIYLDYAAATPLDVKVLKAMEPYFSDRFYNPSATYLAGRGAKKALSEARTSVAMNLGAKPAEIVFTAGATEANNLAIQGVIRQFPDGETMVSAIEHDSVLEPAKLFKHRLVPVAPSGLIELAKLEKMITGRTMLISVGLINNELGTIQPIREVSAIVKRIVAGRQKAGNDTPLYLHTDAAQAGNWLDLHAARLGVDMMSINGGKIYGPKQSGVLFVKTGTKLKPLIVGGGQEWGLRAGTENLAADVGLAAALEGAQAHRAEENRRVSKLRSQFIEYIDKMIPKTIVNGSAKHAAPHIVSLTLSGFDNERLLMELDERGIQCATGSACSASSQEPSHVLAAIGLPPDLARSTLRFSLGRQTTLQQLQVVAESLAELTANR